MEEYPSLVEGTGLENRKVVWAAQGFESLFLRQYIIAGWSSLVARRAHNPEVVGSNPSPATKNGPVVQLVRMPHCHCGGREFESRPDRHLGFII